MGETKLQEKRDVIKDLEYDYGELKRDYKDVQKELKDLKKVHQAQEHVEDGTKMKDDMIKDVGFKEKVMVGLSTLPDGQEDQEFTPFGTDGFKEKFMGWT